MGILSHERILELYDAIVSADLASSRGALLSGIDAHIIARLPIAESLGAQVLRDMVALSEAGVLGDGRQPLAVWLANAGMLAGARAEAGVFARVQEEVAVEQRARSPETGTGRGEADDDDPEHGMPTGDARMFVVQSRDYVGFTYVLAAGDLLVAGVRSDVAVNVLAGSARAFRRWERGEAVRVDALEEEHLRAQVRFVARRSGDHVLWIENRDATRGATVRIHVVIRSVVG